MATISQITDLISFTALNYSGFWFDRNMDMSIFSTSQYGIDWKHTDFTEETYSGDDDDSKNKSISYKVRLQIYKYI